MRKDKGIHRIKITKRELEYKYLELLQSTPDIAKDFGCSKPTILNRLKEYQIPARSGKDAHTTPTYLKKFIMELPKAELYKEYIDNRLGMPEIALQYECSRNCIRNNLLRYGIPIRSKVEAQTTLACIVGREKALASNCSAEGRDKKRQRNIERYRNPKEREKTGLATKRAYLNDPTLRVRQSNNAKARWQDPDIRRKILESLGRVWQDPAWRQARGENLKKLWRDPTIRARWIERRRRFWSSDSPEFIALRQKMIAGLNLRPNKPETVVLDLLNDIFPSEWEYVGDGQVILGGLNPDFVNVNGKKLIIEVFGDYWHTQKLKPYRINKGRVLTYARYGYRTLIIWEKETKNITVLRNKIRDFVKKGEAQKVAFF